MDSLKQHELVEIISLAKEEYLSTARIAKKFNITRYAVHKILEENGVDWRVISTKITPGVAQEVLDLRRESLTCNAIAARTGIGPNTVRKIIRGYTQPGLDRTGIDRIIAPTHKVRWSKERCIALCEEVKHSTESYERIGDRHGISRWYVNNIVNGKVYPDVKLDKRLYKTIRKDLPNVQKNTHYDHRIHRLKKYAAKSKGMRYNEYGMLVPID
jgi:DNA-binding CsgD family transcriptional regulator